jgi:hypothetical protein
MGKKNINSQGIFVFLKPIGPDTSRDKHTGCATNERSGWKIHRANQNSNEEEV